jgi:hypothetical protein
LTVINHLISNPYYIFQKILGIGACEIQLIKYFSSRYATFLPIQVAINLIANNFAKEGYMTKPDTDAGKKTVTITLDDWLKDMIDEEGQRTESSTAEVLERIVLDFIDPSKTDSILELPIEEIQGLANDLLSIVNRIEKITGIRAAAGAPEKT